MTRKKNNSRTTNTIYNFTSSIGGQLITILMQFIVRTVFVYTLGKSYLGINGLFSNILQMLSLAELGVGSAIIFKLYDPIASGNQHRITILMRFYKTVYTVIGFVVVAIGITLIPFLPKLINDYDRLETLNINVIFVFLLYLLQSASSYLFFAYKSAIVRANQKEYLLNLINYMFTVGTGILQIILLYFFKNFEFYVAVLVISVIAENMTCAILANKMYPYINEKTDDKLEKKEVKEVFKDCGALFLYKLNEVVIKSTDNIVLSVFVGLDMVGLYSNYYVFYTTIKTLFEKVFSSMAHSLGNLHTTKDTKHEYEVFEIINLISAILGGTAFVGIFVVADDFVRVWLGSDWIIPQPFSLLMGLEIYTMAIRKVLGKYRNTMGLFQQAKYRPLFGMIINLVMSVVLVNFWGICGVLAGTIIADWTTFMWFDPIIIHKYGFKEKFSVLRYYGKTLKYFFTVAAVAAVDILVCTHFLTNHGWITVICHAAVCGLTVPVFLILVSIKTDEGRFVVNMAKKYSGKIVKKIKKS